MFNFKKNKDIQEMEKLLSGLEKPNLKVSERKELKNRLISQIEAGEAAEHEYVPHSTREFIEKLKNATKGVHVSDWNAFMMKERIMDYVESSAGWRESQIIQKTGSFLRTGVAGFLLFVFAFTAVVVPFRVTRVLANTTYLDQVSGEVKVVRKSVVMKAKPMMQLEEGDLVLTQEGSVATIHFFDDSVTRLAEKTSVQVKKLRKEPDRPSKTEVAVEVDEGRVWVRAWNLAQDSKFSVDTTTVNAEVAKKGAFDLKANEDKTELAVYDNVVEVETKTVTTKKPAKVVIAGYKAAVVASAPDADVVVEKIQDSEDDTVWVAENLTHDAEYQTQLIAGKEEAVKNQKDELLIADNVEGEELDEDVIAAKGKVQEAYKALMEAEEQLVNGDAEKGGQQLEDFKARIQDILDSLSGLEEKDPLYAQVVRDALQDKIDMQLKDLATFGPGDALYKAKEALQETELALAPTDVEKVGVQLAQAEDALLEMQDLLKAGNTEQAAELLNRYHERTNGFSLNVADQNEEELRELFMSLIGKQATHMKVMTSIEQSLELQNDESGFRDEVKQVRDDTLRKFLIALEQNPDYVSDDVLLEVKDLYDSYVVAEDASIEDLIDPAVGKLLAKEYQVSFIAPNLGNEAGFDAIVMVPQEATANVEEEEEEGGSWIGN
ncbi:MAG: DUF5667 domain-containing protein [Candidatus Gracilibacteria bacterium]